MRPSATRSAALPIAAGLVALAAAAPAQPLRWSILASARDARDPEMVAFDERLDRRLIETLNSSDIFEGRLEPVAAGIAELLTARSAFASLHYDPARALALPAAEQQALREFLVRGGFLLLVENDYAHPAAVTRRGAVEGSLLDSFVWELPRSDPAFRVERLPLSHPLFAAPHSITYPEALAREIERSPRYAGEIGVFHEERLAGYVYALYGFESDDGFIPLARPFEPFTLVDAGYHVLINVYSWAMTH